MKTILTFAMAFAAALTIGFAADDDKKGKAEKGKGKKKGGDPAVLFKKLDTDTNGAVSLEEWKAGPQAKKAVAAGKTEGLEKGFAKMAGDDKSLTLEELKAAREARKNKAKGGKKPEGAKGKGKGKKKDAE